MRSTLIRYSRVMEGIFYSNVIISESDSDCLFCSSILNTTAVVGPKCPDVLFIHASGKHRIADLAEILRMLGVPVSVIVDIDILNEKAPFEGLIEKMGGCWIDMEPHWRAIKNDVEGARPPLNAEQVKSLLIKEIEPVSGVNPFPKEAERAIKGIFKSVSPWDVVKQAGRAGLIPTRVD